MTMKLSKKGLLKILDACYFDEDYDQYVLRSLNRKENLFEIQDTTFEANDFQDTVILTVDEASEVWDSLVNLVSYVESIDGGMSVLVRDGQRNIDLIRNRVKKAEGNK